MIMISKALEQIWNQEGRETTKLLAHDEKCQINLSFHQLIMIKSHLTDKDEKQLKANRKK